GWAATGGSARAFAGYRPPADVVAVEFARPGDARDLLIGPRLGLGHAVAQRADAEHATAGGHGVFAFHARAGVEHLGVGQLRHVQAVDHVARARGAGIAFRRHHHAQRRTRIPVGLDALERAVDAGFDERREVRTQPHHDRLRLRVAEADVEFDD